MKNIDVSRENSLLWRLKIMENYLFISKVRNLSPIFILMLLISVAIAKEEEVNTLASEYAKCANVPYAIVEALESKPGEFTLQSRLRFIENNQLEAVIILSDMEYCRANRCLSHFFTQNDSNGCEYQFSARVNPRIYFSSDIIEKYDDNLLITEDYGNDCEVIFRGYCYPRRN